jgi:hypothetical protein
MLSFRTEEDVRAYGDTTKYHKHAEVEVVIAQHPFEVTTIVGGEVERVMRGGVGDAICIGVDGEVWRVERSIFQRTYEPVQKTPKLVIKTMHVDASELNIALFEAMGGRIQLTEEGAYSASRSGYVVNGIGCSPGAAMFNAGIPDLTIDYNALYKLVKRICTKNKLRLEVAYAVDDKGEELVCASMVDSVKIKATATAYDRRIAIGLVCLEILKE